MNQLGVDQLSFASEQQIDQIYQNYYVNKDCVINIIALNSYSCSDTDWKKNVVSILYYQLEKKQVTSASTTQFVDCLKIQF